MQIENTISVALQTESKTHKKRKLHYLTYKRLTPKFLHRY